MLPDWMCSGETYVPSKDKEAFLTKSTKSVLSVLAKMGFYEGKDSRFSATPSLKLFYTLIYIILTASARNYLFVYCSYCMFGKLSVYSDHVCSSDGQTGVFSGKSHPADSEWNSRCGSVFCIDPSTICIYGNSSDFNEYYFKSICICNSGWYFIIRDILE